jgi:hypothetical protein
VACVNSFEFLFRGGLVSFGVNSSFVVFDVNFIEWKEDLLFYRSFDSLEVFRVAELFLDAHYRFILIISCDFPHCNACSQFL